MTDASGEHLLVWSGLGAVLGLVLVAAGFGVQWLRRRQ